MTSSACIVGLALGGTCVPLGDPALMREARLLQHVRRRVEQEAGGG